MTRELLSEVLIDKQIDYVEVKDNQVWFHKTDSSSMVHTWSDMCINIHELAQKCKEWAIDLEYEFVIDYHTNRNTIRVYLNNTEVYYLFSEHRHTPEDIFTACEWILGQKEIEL